jgi:hypothetical protein
MKTPDYKLREYRIYQEGNGLFWWETHCGFGVQRRGMCFIWHDILILGPCSHEEIGYLKGEYLYRLEKLASWNKTKYYCFASELLDVISGRSLDHNFMSWMYSSVSTGRNGAGPILERDSGTFRLDKYQITATPNGDITWQAYGRMNRVLSGQCSIQSGVLFIGAEEQDKEGANKEECFKKQYTLPRWDKTRIWSRSLALQPCHPLQHEAKPHAALHKIVSAWESNYAKEKHPLIYEEQLQSQIRSLWPSRFKANMCSWSRSRLHLAFRFGKQLWPIFKKAKFWSISLIFFVMAGLFIAD